MKPEWMSEELWIELLAQRVVTREFYERGKTMTNDNGQEMTPQAVAIVEAIDLGNSRMTKDRWAEEAEKSAQFEDEGEWFAPEFKEAREATEGLSWDFDGWESVRSYVMSGRFAGESMVSE